jgi:phage/plasmid-associated DNA primase
MSERYEEPELKQAFYDMIVDILGCMIIGNRGKYAVWLVAPPNTGKSSLLEPAVLVLGTYGHSAPRTLFNQVDGEANIALGDCQDKTVVIVPELETTDKKFNEELFKAMTGGDRVSARIMYTGYTKFVFRGLIIIVSNQAPIFRNASTALQTRVKIITLTEDFKKYAEMGKIKRIDDAPVWIGQNEAEGVFRLIVESASRLLNSGSLIPRFMDEVEENTVDMFNDQSVYAAFINEKLEYSLKSVIEIGDNNSEIYQVYEAFAREYAAKNGWSIIRSDEENLKNNGQFFLASPGKLRNKLKAAGLSITPKSIRVPSKVNPTKIPVIRNYKLKDNALPKSLKEANDL